MTFVVVVLSLSLPEVFCGARQFFAPCARRHLCDPRRGGTSAHMSIAVRASLERSAHSS